MSQIILKEDLSYVIRHFLTIWQLDNFQEFFSYKCTLGRVRKMDTILSLPHRFVTYPTFFTSSW